MTSEVYTRRLFAAAMLLALAFTSLVQTGCSRPIQRIGILDELAIAYRDRVWTQRAYTLRYANCNREYEDHFRSGFYAGYSDICHGEDGYTPALPPDEYRGYEYQCADGSRCVDAWFEGYPAGVAAAREEKAGNYHEMHISQMIDRAITQTNAPNALPSDVPVTKPSAKLIPPMSSVVSKRFGQRDTASTQVPQIGNRPDPKPIVQAPKVQTPRVAAKPTVMPMAAKPTTHSVFARPSVIKPVAAKQVAAKQVAAKPVAAKPVSVKPDSVKPAVVTKPKVVTPTIAKPSVVEPKTLPPIRTAKLPRSVPLPTKPQVQIPKRLPPIIRSEAKEPVTQSVPPIIRGSKSKTNSMQAPPIVQGSTKVSSVVRPPVIRGRKIDPSASVSSNEIPMPMSVRSSFETRTAAWPVNRK